MTETPLMKQQREQARQEPSSDHIKLVEILKTVRRIDAKAGALGLRPDLQRAIDNLAQTTHLSLQVTLCKVIERGLSGLADDRGEG